MIFLDTNVVSEPLRLQPDPNVLAGLKRHDAVLSISEDAAVCYGLIMGEASRTGRPMSAQDGMIAAIAKIHNATLATRNTRDFENAGIAVVNPWNYA